MTALKPVYHRNGFEKIDAMRAKLTLWCVNDTHFAKGAVRAYLNQCCV